MKKLILLLQLVLVTFGYGEKSKRHDCGDSDMPPDPKSLCCGVEVTVNNRIIGGEPTALMQYPWLALVEYTNKRHPKRPARLFCGAFLISSLYVVTAAHCVSGSLDEEWKPTAIRLGEYDKSNPGKDCVNNGDGEVCTIPISIPIEKVIVHENYVYNMTSIVNDIALIKLKKRAPYTEFIRPICLPPSDFTITTQPPPSLELHVAGWGVMKQIKGPGGYKNIDSKIKQHVKVPYVPFEDCRKKHPMVTKSHICAGGKGKDACMGDSGGPLMMTRNGVLEAVGVVSYGPGAPCGMKGVPGVYTKVFDFKDWILKRIG